jgi:fructose-1,6-bisphosphatase/inositol monophosphatase family enzyme
MPTKKKYSHHRSKDQAQLNISMPSETKELLKDYCTQNDLNVSQFVRKILREKGPEYGLDVKKELENDD